jgi:hypothetical protein
LKASIRTTLALPYVATGRVAAHVLFWTWAIHVAAGSLLVTSRWRRLRGRLAVRAFVDDARRRPGRAGNNRA